MIQFKTKLIIALMVLCIVDVVLPIPILGATLVYVVVQTPPWFPDMVERVYRAQ